MDIPFHYLRKAATFIFAAYIFWVVYTIARPGVGSAIGATFFAAFGAFAASCLALALVQIILCTIRYAWLKETHPYLKRRFTKPVVPYNWMQ